jgi:hypothetical protein
LRECHRRHTGAPPGEREEREMRRIYMEKKIKI